MIRGWMLGLGVRVGVFCMVGVVSTQSRVGPRSVSFLSIWTCFKGGAWLGIDPLTGIKTPEFTKSKSVAQFPQRRYLHAQHTPVPRIASTCIAGSAGLQRRISLGTSMISRSIGKFICSLTAAAGRSPATNGDPSVHVQPTNHSRWRVLVIGSRGVIIFHLLGFGHIASKRNVCRCQGWPVSADVFHPLRLPVLQQPHLRSITSRSIPTCTTRWYGKYSISWVLMRRLTPS